MRTLIFIFLFFPLGISAQSWYNMGGGVLYGSDPNCHVSAISSYQDQIIIGGYFKTSSISVTKGVARWNGTEWTSLGIGIWTDWTSDSTGNGGGGLEEYNNKLYSCGIFTGAGGNMVNDPLHFAGNITKWDGIDWYPISPLPDPSGINGSCGAIFQYKDNLYFGGLFSNAFDSAGNHPAAGIVKWNDTVFSSVGQFAGNFPPFSYHSALEFTEYNNKLIAGGFFTSIDGSPYGSFSGIAAWNDTVWSALSTGFNDAVYALTVFNGELYAGGKFTATGDNLTPLNHIAKWDGIQWLAVGEGLNDTVLTLCVDSLNNKLIAGGKFTQTGFGLPAKYIAEWNGTSWQELGGGTNDIVWSLFFKDSNLYVGGEFTQVGAVSANHIAVWGNNPVGINEINNQNKSLSIYPNPSQSIITFEFELSETKNISIEIKNILGQTIKTIDTSILIIGKNKIEISINEFSSGVYFIRLESKDFIMSEKFIK